MKTFALASVAALCCSQVDALPGFVSLIPGASNVNGVDAIGHVDPSGGGPRNAFGQDFGKAGKKWSVDLCYKDSDNDGQFNGAELGDPCCEWVKGSNEKLAYSSASSPGDASSKQNPSIWASVKCANGQDPLTKFQAYSGGGAPAPAPAPTPAPTPAPGPGPGPAPTTASPSPGGNSTPAPGPDATPATTTATPKVTTAAPKDDSSTSKPSASTSAPTSTTSEASSSSSDADEVTSAPATTGSSSGADTSIDEISTPAPTPSKTPVATTAAPKSSAVRTLVAASAVAVAVVTWAL